MNVIDNSHMEAILNYVADHYIAKFEIWHTNDGRKLSWHASIKYKDEHDLEFYIPWDELAQPGHDESGATLSEVLQRMSYWVGQQIQTNR